MRPLINIVLSFIFLFSMLSIAGCSKENRENGEANLQLKDIAYDVFKSQNNIVYIEENNEYVPYIVLTDRYNNVKDTALLLRRDLMPNTSIFSEHYSSPYYGYSYIDTYLNNDFFSFLSEDIKDNILDTDIKILSLESIGVAGRSISTINRKIFLLSVRETGLSSRYGSRDEGYLIKYFEEDEKRIAYQNEAPYAWWLRSLDNRDFRAYCVSQIGLFVHQPTETSLGVRPAFCLNGNIAVKKAENVIAGQMVNVLDFSVGIR